LSTASDAALPVRLSLNPLPLDTAAGVCMVVTNLTDERRREASLLASLREKEALLREIHHRVKNNLQVVAGLLHLQARRTTEPETRGVFVRSENRVLSMALIHESLYQSEDLAAVSFGTYLEKLVEQLLGAHRPERDTIRIVVMADEVLLPLETAVPLGLVVNELVTNAFKHAFTGRPGGEIRVELIRLAEGRMRVVVEDDGVGWDGGKSAGRNTLGMQLVRTLVGQIDGELDVRGGPGGTSFRIQARVGGVA
ncbi:MAG: sensor histidine kinase, partial [Myxococcota bacterium]